MERSLESVCCSFFLATSSSDLHDSPAKDLCHGINIVFAFGDCSEEAIGIVVIVSGAEGIDHCRR